MNLNHILYFCAVTTTGSYTRAAEKMGVSEPVVHRAIGKLERSLGLKLFHRRGKFVYLTPIGEAIFEYASRIALFADMTEQVVAEQKTHVSGRLSIGAGTTAMSFLLPTILPLWSSRHALVDISITQGQPDELEKGLLQGHIDLAICPGMQWASNLTKELIFSDRLVAVSATSHHLSERNRVSISEFSREKIIVTPRGFSVREIMEEVGRQYGVQFKCLLEVNRLDTAKRLSRAGMGIAVVPLSLAAEEVAAMQLSVLDVEGFPRSSPYFLIYRSDRILTREMKSFICAVQSWVQENGRLARSSSGQL